MKKLNLFYSVLIMMLLSGCSSQITSNSLHQENTNIIKISLSELSTTAKFYDFTNNGINIKYFVVLDSNGQPKVAFDACDVCGGYKGYRQEGDEMICNNCGQHFKIDALGLNNKGYGCWPSNLPAIVSDGNVIIKESDIILGESKFS